MSDKKAYELFIGYKIVVMASNADEVRSSAKTIVTQMGGMVPARELVVRETLAERGDGRWVVEDGALSRIPIEIGTFEELRKFKTTNEDLACVAEAEGALYLYSDTKKPTPAAFATRTVPSNHGGYWVPMEAIQEAMRGGGGASK